MLNCLNVVSKISYVPPDDKTSSTMTIPLDKVEDFGVHYKEYYELSIEMFKSTQDAQLLDLLWNQYWIDTLSSAPLKANAKFSKDRIKDAVQKLDKIDISNQAPVRLMMQMDRKSRSGGSKNNKSSSGTPDSKEEQPLTQLALETAGIASDHLQGLSNVVVKQSLFHADPNGGMCTCTRPRLFQFLGANGDVNGGDTNGLHCVPATTPNGHTDGMDVG